MIPESASRRALVLQPSPEAGPGTLEMPLHDRGYAVDLWFVPREAAPPSPLESYDAVISLGGPAQLDAYHWHAVSFEAPDSGTLLAESETNQEVFRIGSAWGIQYHPCLDLPQVAIWIESRARRSRRRASIRTCSGATPPIAARVRVARPAHHPPARRPRRARAARLTAGAAPGVVTPL